MNKFYALLAALVVCLSGLVFVAPSVSAASSKVVCVERHYGRSATPVQQCLQVNYSLQRDGTGVKLNGYKITTPKGCGRLEDPYPYEQIAFGWVDPNRGTIKYSLSGGSQYDCEQYYPLSVKGSDRGRMLARWSADVRVNLGEDRRFGQGIYINPNYTSDKAWAYDSDDPSLARVR